MLNIIKNERPREYLMLAKDVEEFLLSDNLIVGLIRRYCRFTRKDWDLGACHVASMTSSNLLNLIASCVCNVRSFQSVRSRVTSVQSLRVNARSR